MLLAAITAFYDASGREGEDFFIYPDYFLFHVDGPLATRMTRRVRGTQGGRGSEHDDGEVLLEAINDRGITWLLVEDRERATRSCGVKRWPAPGELPGRWLIRREDASRGATCGSRATTSPSPT